MATNPPSEPSRLQSLVLTLSLQFPQEVGPQDKQQPLLQPAIESLNLFMPTQPVSRQGVSRGLANCYHMCFSNRREPKYNLA